MTEQIKEVYIENKLDYGKFILDPKISEKYPEITKDYPLANLDIRNLRICELRQEIMNILILNIHCFKKSIEAFERDQHTTLQLSRSRYGFQSKLERSNLAGDTTDTRNFEKEKKKTIFSRGGGNY